MNSATSANDKNHQSSDNSNKAQLRNALPQGDFNQVHYNKMVDESKHTDFADEDRDLSIQYDHYAETQLQQDSDRNLTYKNKSTKNKDSGALTIEDLNSVNTTQQQQSPDPLSTKKGKDNQNGKYKLTKGFSQDDYEEQKTHDFLKKGDLYADNEYEDHKNISKNYQHFNTDGYVDDFEDLDQQQYNSSQNNTQQVQQKPKFSGYTLKPQLPQLKVNIPLAISGNDVFEIFTNICKNQKFQVIEMDQNIATAVNKEPFSLKKIFQRCLPFQDAKRDTQVNESQISAVRLQISVNEVKVCRKIALKGLYGDQSKLQEFLSHFKNKLHETVQRLPPSQRDNNAQNNSGQYLQTGGNTPGHKKNIDSRTQITITNRSNKGNGRRIPSNEDSDEEQSAQYNETSSIYQIHKILSSDQYTLGKNVAQYIECFHLQYKSLRESATLLPQPMEGIMGLIQETVQSFNSEYNLGKQHAKSLMTHCRPSAEKYVFSKLYDKLFAMYAIKNEDEDRLFIERSQLLKRQRAHDLMKYLGIKNQFIIGENAMHTMKFEDHIKDLTVGQNNISQYDSHRSDMNLHHNNTSGVNNSLSHEHMFNQTSTSSAGSLPTPGGSISQNLNQNRSDLPYIEAIRCLEKMQQYQSPREKLHCISESFGQLKTIIVEHWKGKLELNAMDDVLPLTIYVVAMADLSHPQSELNIMEDYLRVYDKGFEFEKKLLTNFDVSIRYVNHEWEIENTN